MHGPDRHPEDVGFGKICLTILLPAAVAFALLPWTALDATWLWNGLLWIAVDVLYVGAGPATLASATAAGATALRSGTTTTTATRTST